MTRTDLSGSLLVDLTGSVDLGGDDLIAVGDGLDELEPVDLVPERRPVLFDLESELIRCQSVGSPQSAFPALIASRAVSFPDKCAMEYPDAGSKDGYAGLLTRGLLDLASWATKDGMTWKTL